MRDEDLQSDFGISVRLHRVKILEGIKKLQVQASTVTQLHQQQFLQYQQQLHSLHHQ
jgi:hypothetical protein